MKQYKWKNIKTNIISVYDNDIQRRIKAKKQKWKIRERSVFLSYLQNEKKRNLLEVGAGVGKDSLFFKKHGLKVTTTDISSANVRQCKKQGLRAFVLDVYDLGKLRRKYDAIYALNSLLHVPKKDFELILRKIKSLLNPAGLFYLGMYGGDDFQGILKEDRCEPKRFFSFFLTEQLLSIVQKHFKLEYFRHIIPFKDGGTFQSIILRKR
jgi:2-polyprenyl-3-methyl-5-hydroxy-6-metoxy-1,4-benzoquinol methylase